MIDLDEFSLVVKALQLEFSLDVGTSFTFSNSNVLKLINILDGMFMDGLRNRQLGYWVAMQKLTPRYIAEFIEQQCPAYKEHCKGALWLCIALNDKQLEFLLVTFQKHRPMMERYYYSSAFLFSVQVPLFQGILCGLEAIPFNLCMDVKALEIFVATSKKRTYIGHSRSDIGSSVTLNADSLIHYGIKLSNSLLTKIKKHKNTKTLVEVPLISLNTPVFSGKTSCTAADLINFDDDIVQASIASSDANLSPPDGCLPFNDPWDKVLAEQAAVMPLRRLDANIVLLDAPVEVIHKSRKSHDNFQSGGFQSLPTHSVTDSPGCLPGSHVSLSHLSFMQQKEKHSISGVVSSLETSMHCCTMEHFLSCDIVTTDSTPSVAVSPLCGFAAPEENTTSLSTQCLCCSAYPKCETQPYQLSISRFSEFQTNKYDLSRSVDFVSCHYSEISLCNSNQSCSISNGNEIGSQCYFVSCSSPCKSANVSTVTGVEYNRLSVCTCAEVDCGQVIKTSSVEVYRSHCSSFTNYDALENQPNHEIILPMDNSSRRASLAALPAHLTSPPSTTHHSTPLVDASEPLVGVSLNLTTHTDSSYLTFTTAMPHRFTTNTQASLVYTSPTLLVTPSSVTTDNCPILCCGEHSKISMVHSSHISSGPSYKSSKPYEHDFLLASCDSNFIISHGNSFQSCITFAPPLHSDALPLSSTSAGVASVMSFDGKSSSPCRDFVAPSCHKGISHCIDSFVRSSELPYMKFSAPSYTGSAAPCCSGSSCANSSALSSIASEPSFVVFSAPFCVNFSEPSCVTFSEPSCITSSEPSFVVLSAPSCVTFSEPTSLTSSEPSFVTSSEPSCVMSSKPCYVDSSEPSFVASFEPFSVASSEPSCVATSEPSCITFSIPSCRVSSEPSFIAASEPSCVAASVPSCADFSELVCVASSEPPYIDSSPPSYVVSSEPSYVNSSSLSHVTCSEPTFVKSSAPSYLDSSELSYVGLSEPSYGDSSESSCFESSPSCVPSYKPPCVDFSLQAYVHFSEPFSGKHTESCVVDPLISSCSHTSTRTSSIESTEPSGILKTNNHLLLHLMLNILHSEDEKIVKMLSVPFENVTILFTDKFVYILRGLDGSLYRWKSFCIDDVVVKSLYQLQGVAFACSDATYHCCTANPQLTLDILETFHCFTKTRDSVTVQALKDSDDHKTLLVYIIAEYLSRNNCDISKFFVARFQKDAAGTQAGNLQYRSGRFALAWKTAYFVLDDGILYQYQNMKSSKPSQSVILPKNLKVKIDGATVKILELERLLLEFRASTVEESLLWADKLKFHASKQENHSLTCFVVASSEHLFVVSQHCLDAFALCDVIDFKAEEVDCHVSVKRRARCFQETFIFYFINSVCCKSFCDFLKRA